MKPLALLFSALLLQGCSSPPIAPVTVNVSTNAVVSWSPVWNAEGYNLYQWPVAGGSMNILPVGDVTNVTVTVSNESNFAVTSTNQNGESPMSSVVEWP